MIMPLRDDVIGARAARPAVDRPGDGERRPLILDRQVEDSQDDG